MAKKQKKQTPYSLGNLASDLLASKKRKVAPREASKKLVAGFRKQKTKLSPPRDGTLNA
jgi:hypothetical protein